MKISSISPIQLKVPRAMERQFKKAARDAFPQEIFAFVLGDKVNGDRRKRGKNLYKIRELWFPEGIYQTNYLHTSPEEDAMVMEYARSQGLSLLGDIHSHPYTWKELKDSLLVPEHTMSERDFKDIEGQFGIFGICRVVERKDGKKLCSIRWWGPTIPVEVTKNG